MKLKIYELYSKGSAFSINILNVGVCDYSPEYSKFYKGVTEISFAWLLLQNPAKNFE